MRRHILPIVAACALAWLYCQTIIWVMSQAAFALGNPAVFHALKSTHLLSVGFLYVEDLVLTVVVSIPFAYVIARLYGRRWLLVAILGAGFTAAQDWVAIPIIWRELKGHQLYLTSLLIETMRLMIVLPILTYCLHRLSSGIRLSRPNHG